MNIHLIDTDVDIDVDFFLSSFVFIEALTVGVGTVMDSKEVMILITGAHKAFALYKAIEEGVNHMWTVSAFQQHANTLMICDEDATLELRVKTVKYFKVNVAKQSFLSYIHIHYSLPS